MNSIDLMLMVIKNLFRRKMRTFLTMLGIVIGTVSIAVMMVLRIGMRESLKNQLDEFVDSNIMEVNIPRNTNNYEALGKKLKRLKDEDIRAFSEIEGVKAVTPQIRMQVVLRTGRYKDNIACILGMTPDFLKEYGLIVHKGRMLEKGYRMGMFLGAEVPFEFLK